MRRLRNWTSLLLASTAVALAADYLPLEAGNSWTYRDAQTGQTLEMRVATPGFINQKTYFALKGYTPQQLWVRIAEDGNLYYFDEELDRERLLTSFTASASPFEAPARECPEWGQVRERPGSHEGPAGKWQVLEVEYESHACADAGDQVEQFAANVGMARRVVTTIAGPRTLDLVYAKVGRSVIRAGESASFGLSVVEEPGSWLVTLRVEQSPDSNLELMFPASQECDLALKDASGRVVWKWSDGQFYIPIIHSRRIAGGFSAVIRVPHPPAVPEGDRVYTLEGWLTTMEGQPRFGAATTVTARSGGGIDTEVLPARSRR